METTLVKRKRGQQLLNAERNVLISKLVDCLCEGYTSTNSLAKRLGVDNSTIETYRPLADELIGKMKLDRNVIRNLQVKRTYKIIEDLMKDLKQPLTVKEKSLIYSQIVKFSQHLSLITGLNIETQVNVDHQQLVIIRADNNEKKPTITKEVIDQ